MSDKECNEAKVINQFTAYLRSFVRGKREVYLNKKILHVRMEESMIEDMAFADRGSLDDYMETARRERILLDESKSRYPAWDDLGDQRLIKAMLLLRDNERKLIYQHVFEERGFEEMSILNNLPEDRVKGRYYYAINKIRRWMGGDLL